MQYFSLLIFQHWALALFLGVGLALLLFAGWVAVPPRKKEEEGDAELGQYEEGSPIPPFLVLAFIGIPIWAVLYMIVIGMNGGSF